MSAETYLAEYRKNPYYCVDCGAVAIPCPSRTDGEDTFRGFYQCSCGSKDQFGHNHEGKFPRKKDPI